MEYEYNLHIFESYEHLSQRRGLMLCQPWEQLILLVLVVKNTWTSLKELLQRIHESPVF